MLALAALAGWERLRRPVILRGAAIIGIAFILGLYVRSGVRNADWRDARRITSRDVQSYPQSAALQAIAAFLEYGEAAGLPAGPARETGLAGAQQRAEQSLRIADSNTIAMRILVDILVARGDVEPAIVLLRRLLELRPEVYQLRCHLASLLADRDPAEALRHAREAHRQSPMSLQTRLTLVEALAGAGEPAEALGLLRSVMQELPPNHEWMPVMRGRADELQRLVGARAGPAGP
jgi:predicted Zn-dependent protease